VNPLGLVQTLLKLGIPLSSLANIPGLGDALGGLGGLLGLGSNIDKGNIPGAIGGAAKLGSQAADLLDMPGVSEGLGMVGSPLSFATGLATGNPMQAITGGLQTANMASGALGGPTLASLTGVSGLGSALAAPLFAISLGMIDNKGADLFDSLFGNQKSHEQRQGEEYQKYADELPGLIERRVKGASLFDTLGDVQTPEGILDALKTAASGRSANVDPAAWNVGHTPGSLKGSNFQAPDLSKWFEASPGLAGKNWGSFLNLMDKGEKAGLDPGSKTGGWDQDVVNQGGYFVPGENVSGEDYRTRKSMPLEQVQAISRGDDSHRDAAGPTREAQDMGNAVSGIGRALGIDFDTLEQGNDRDYDNFDSEQLGGYGMTPGNYGPSVLNYLRSLAPEIVNHPEYLKYASTLGDPSMLDLLNITPRKKPQTGGEFAAPQFNDSPGGM
jgi:hypothetical protein